MKKGKFIILGVIGAGVTASIIAYKAIKQMSEEEIYDDEDDISFEDDVAYSGRYPRQVETLDEGEYPLKNVNKGELEEAVKISNEAEEELADKLASDYHNFLSGIKNNCTILPRLTEGVSINDPELSHWCKNTIEIYLKDPTVLDLYYFKASSLLNIIGISIENLAGYIMTLDESKKTEKVKRIFGDLCLLGNKISITLSENRIIRSSIKANYAYNITLMLHEITQFFHNHEAELISESSDDEKVKIFISKINSDLENGLYLNSYKDKKEDTKNEVH